MKLLQRCYRRIRSFPLDAVTDRDEASEQDPREVGLSKEDVDTIWQSVQSLYQSRTNPAVALCLRRRGKILINRAIGHARGNEPGTDGQSPVPIKTSSLFNLFSASKAITAMVIHHLDDKGLLHIDDSVAEYLPRFTSHGKSEVRIRHLLNHRAGLPRLPGRLDVAVLEDWDYLIESLCDAKLVSKPGGRLAYHALTSGFIMGEIVWRITGKSIRDYLKETMLDPLEISHLNYGVPRNRVNEVVPNTVTGAPIPWPLSMIIKRALGVNMNEAIAASNHPSFLSGIVPSGNIVGTAEETCRFYQMLLDGGRWKDHSIFDLRTIRRAISEQSYLEPDYTLGFPVRYSLGFMLGSNYISPYGLWSSRAFGHIGLSNVVAYADPERDISVSLMTSGKAILHTGALPWIKVMWTIANRIPKDGRGPLMTALKQSSASQS
ncbi:MAG: serine hydrolase [Planctomycetota bacterium]|nr:serine hydrolase [Planctomycetota bacterium]